MKLYFVKTPKFVQRLFPKRTWMFSNDNNLVYITFDDGPIPKVTPWVLDLLKSYNSKATFFCIGDNINKHPNIFKRLVWMFSNDNNLVYITFDDGPIPKVTPWVLDLLKSYNSKATFFCIGDNINKHPNIFKRLVAEGHSIGNHTYHHLKGWNTKTESYYKDIIKCEELISSELRIQNSELLFRPPYGKLTTRQSKILQKKGYKTIMWNVLSGDFDPQITKEKCLENVIKNIQPGSVIVFHDSLKSEDKLRYVLPKVLDFIRKNKWECAKI